MTDKPKKLIIVAGANGAGKSTFTKEHSFDEIILDPDIIAQKLDTKRVENVRISAGRETVRLSDHYLDTGQSFVRETTLSGRSAINLILKAKTKGFHIELHYIGVSSVSWLRKRINFRKSVGGHDIPAPDIERRYFRSLRNLQDVIKMVDVSFIYDNSIKRKLVASIKNNELYVHQEKLPEWCNFLENCNVTKTLVQKSN